MSTERIIYYVIVLVVCLAMGWHIYKDIAESKKQAIKEREELARIKEIMGYSETKKETIRSIEELEKVLIAVKPDRSP